MDRPLAELPIPHVRCELPTPDIYVVELAEGLVALVDERVTDDYLEKFGEYLRVDIAVSDEHRPHPALSPARSRSIATAAARICRQIRRESMAGRAASDAAPRRDPPEPAPAPRSIHKKGVRVDLDPHRRTGVPGPMVDVRTDIAHTARVYDYLLGGKDNYMPDRDVGDGLMHAFPTIVQTFRNQRAFMHRTVRHISELGVEQFLDVGTGIPTSPNLHEIAQEVNPNAHVVYVDNDPIVLAHSTALMVGTTTGSLHYLEADAREPEQIVTNLTRLDTIELDQPISVSTIGLLHFLDDQAAENLIQTLMAAVPSGSYLTLTQATSVAAGDDDSDYADAIDAYRSSGIQVYLRDPGQIQSWCSDLQLVDPGLTFIHRWRPDASIGDGSISDRDMAVIGMVARKP